MDDFTKHYTAVVLFEKLAQEAEFISVECGPEYHATCSNVAKLAREQRDKACVRYDSIRALKG